MPDIETRQDRPGEYDYAESVALGGAAIKMEVNPTYRLLERRAGTCINAAMDENCAGSSSSKSCDQNSDGHNVHRGL